MKKTQIGGLPKTKKKERKKIIKMKTSRQDKNNLDLAEKRFPELEDTRRSEEIQNAAERVKELENRLRDMKVK